MAASFKKPRCLVSQGAGNYSRTSHTCIVDEYINSSKSFDDCFDEPRREFCVEDVSTITKYIIARSSELFDRYNRLLFIKIVDGNFCSS
jgi:hypothetical protein